MRRGGRKKGWGEAQEKAQVGEAVRKVNVGKQNKKHKKFFFLNWRSTKSVSAIKWLR